MNLNKINYTIFQNEKTNLLRKMKDFVLVCMLIYKANYRVLV